MNDHKIAFLFPGQGSQTVGMGRELRDLHPAARATFEEADDALGFNLTRLIFDGPEDQLKMTEITQPALLTVSVAAYRVLAANRIEPDLAAGHSLGEYSAHVAVGTLSLADAVRTVRNRGRYMQEAVPAGVGAMAAILNLSAEQVTKVCEEASKAGTVETANFNSPAQTVISGTVAGVERAMVLAKEAGARKAVMLPVSAPFHCSLMQPAQDRLAADLSTLTLSPMKSPVMVNIDATFVHDSAIAREALVRQVTGSVRWVECMQGLIAAGVTHFVEVGPGKVLCGLLRQIDKSKLAINVEDADSLKKSLEVLQKK